MQSDTTASAKSYRFVPTDNAQPYGETSSSIGVFAFTAAVFVIAFAIVFALLYALVGSITLVVVGISALVAFLAALAIHIAQQWEKVVVLRFGKYSRTVGPGLYVTIPLQALFQSGVTFWPRAISLSGTLSRPADVSELLVISRSGTLSRSVRSTHHVSPLGNFRCKVNTFQSESVQKMQVFSVVKKFDIRNTVLTSGFANNLLKVYYGVH